MSKLTKAIADTAARRMFRAATVTAVSDHGPRFRSIELTGDALKTAGFSVGDKIQVRTDADGLAMRTYTPIGWDSGRGATTLLAYTHGTGPRSAWAETTSVGSTCQFFGPRSSLKLAELTAPVVFVGDETSFALTAAWHRAHPDNPPVAELFEVSDPDACRPALEAVDLTTSQLFRREAHHAHLDQLTANLVEVLRADDNTALCLTGRAQTIAAIRRTLKDSGLSGRTSRVKAYWDENRSGLD